VLTFLMILVMPGLMMGARHRFGSLVEIFVVAAPAFALILARSSQVQRFNCPRCGKRFNGFNQHGSMTRQPMPACNNCDIRAGTPKFALSSEPGMGGD
jgi:hypothetical protein